MYQNVSKSSYYDRLQVSAWNATVVSVGDVPADRRHLRSSDHGQLVVPCYRLTTASRRAFSCAGPSAWNSLPVFLRDEMLTVDSFKCCLNVFCLLRTDIAHGAREIL